MLKMVECEREVIEKDKVSGGHEAGENIHKT